MGRVKHMWVSIGSDLRIDTRRDLDDAGAHHIPVHPLNKLPYGPLASGKVCLLFVQHHSCVFREAVCSHVSMGGLCKNQSCCVEFLV